jgi:NADH-quinone oxidoreductase subunit I
LDPSACRAPDGCAECVSVCLPAALRLEAPIESARPDRLVLDYGRCIMCGLCVPACPTSALRMEPDYELAVTAVEDLKVTLSWGGG